MKDIAQPFESGHVNRPERLENARPVESTRRDGGSRCERTVHPLQRGAPRLGALLGPCNADLRRGEVIPVRGRLFPHGRKGVSCLSIIAGKTTRNPERARSAIPANLFRKIAQTMRNEERLRRARKGRVRAATQLHE